MNKMNITEWVDQNEQRLVDLSKAIWEHAEVSLREFKSSDLLASELERVGFEVERGVADMPTAFIATYGSGKPIIGVLGEYDALPGLSQKVSAVEEPVESGGAGHGCGHNLLGVGSLGGILALKETMADNGLPGTIKYFGCPAEETLVGKVFMARDGLFNDLDAALTWHPSSINSTWRLSSLALNSVKFNFHGVPAHAAVSPENGRSALDGVMLMDIGVNYLREHIAQESRIHSVITEGGKQPNVVPSEAQIWYYIRAPRRKLVEEIYKRVLDIAKGASLMTGTTFSTEFLVGCYDYVSNETLTQVLEGCFKEVGAPEFKPEAQQLARQLEDTFSPGQKEAALRTLGNPTELTKITLHEEYLEGGVGKGRVLPGSTDVGDVSYIAPTAQFTTCCQPIGTAGHSWQVTAACGSMIGQQGMMIAAKVLALGGLELLTKPQVLKDARKEFEEMVEREGRYESPVPADLTSVPGLLRD